MYTQMKNRLYESLCSVLFFHYFFNYLLYFSYKNFHARNYLSNQVFINVKVLSTLLHGATVAIVNLFFAVLAIEIAKPHFIP